MVVNKDASNQDVTVCDGCGRSDAGPSSPLDIQGYAVNDAGIGSVVKHHYCTHCANNRHASIELLNFTSGTGTPLTPSSDSPSSDSPMKLGADEVEATPQVA